MLTSTLNADQTRGQVQMVSNTLHRFRVEAEMTLARNADKVKEFEVKLQGQNQLIDKIAQDRDKAKMQLEVKSQELAETRSALDTKSGRIQILENGLGQMDKVVRAQETAVVALDTFKKAASIKLAQMENAFADLTLQHVDKVKGLKANLDAYERQMAEVEKSLELAKGDINDLSEEVQVRGQTISRMEAQANGLDNQLQERTIKIDLLEGQIKAKEAELSHFKAETEEKIEDYLQCQETLKQEVENGRDSARDLNSKLSQKEEEIKTHKRDLEVKQEEKKTLEVKLLSLEENKAKVEEQREELIDELDETRSELEKAKMELKECRDDAAKSEEEAKAAEEAAEKAKHDLGRQLNAKSAEIEALTSSVNELKKADCELRLLKENFKKELGNSAKLRDEIQELQSVQLQKLIIEEENNSLKKQLKNSQMELKKAANAVTEKQVDIDEKAKQLSAANEKAKQSKVDSAAVKDLRQRLDREKANNKSESERLNEDLKARTEQLAALKKDLAAEKTEKAKYERLTEELKGRMDSQKEEVDKLKKAKVDLEKKLVSMEKKQDSAAKKKSGSDSSEVGLFADLKSNSPKKAKRSDSDSSDLGLFVKQQQQAKAGKLKVYTPKKSTARPKRKLVSHYQFDEDLDEDEDDLDEADSWNPPKRSFKKPAKRPFGGRLNKFKNPPTFDKIIRAEDSDSFFED